jgi:hypothetical protein
MGLSQKFVPQETVGYGARTRQDGGLMRALYCRGVYDVPSADASIGLSKIPHVHG